MKLALIAIAMSLPMSLPEKAEARRRPQYFVCEYRDSAGREFLGGSITINLACRQAKQECERASRGCRFVTVY